MSRYSYLKVKTKKTPFFIPLNLKWFSGGFLAFGFVLLANVFLPILFYQFRAGINFRPVLISPLGKKHPSFINSQDGRLHEQGKVLAKNLSFFPADWQVKASPLIEEESKITHYTLSIPKLKIKDAVVEIGGEDLMENLIHYKGTALPGQYGNAVIFGHSSLPQFFQPNNYKTIFSTLPTLKKGDEILVNYDGITYQFKVTKMVEVKPDDLSVLAQHYDNQYLSLITCTPPGQYWRRLIVQAQLK